MASLNELRQELREVAQEALEFERQAENAQAVGARAARCLSALLAQALESCRLEESYRELLSYVAALNAGLLAPGRMDFQGVLAALSESHAAASSARERALKEVGELLPELEACAIRKQDVERGLLALQAADLSVDPLFSDAIQADLPLSRGRRIFLQPGDIFTRSRGGGLEPAGSALPGQEGARPAAAFPPVGQDAELLRLREQNAELQRNLSLTLTALASKQPAIEVADLDGSRDGSSRDGGPRDSGPREAGMRSSRSPRSSRSSRSPAARADAPAARQDAPGLALDPALERDLRQTCARVAEMQGVLQQLQARVAEQGAAHAGCGGQPELDAEELAAGISADLAANLSASLSTCLLDDVSPAVAGQVSERLSAQFAEELAGRLSERVSEQLSARPSLQLPPQIASQLASQVAPQIAPQIAPHLARLLEADLSASISQQLSEAVCAQLESSLQRQQVEPGPAANSGSFGSAGGPAGASALGSTEALADSLTASLAASLGERLSQAVRSAATAGSAALEELVRSSFSSSARGLEASVSPAVASAVQDAIRTELPGVLAPLLASGADSSAPLAELRRALETVESSLRQEKDRSRALGAELDEQKRRNASLEASLSQAESSGTVSLPMLQRLSSLFGDVALACATLSDAVAEARARGLAHGVSGASGASGAQRPPCSRRVFILTSLDDVERSLSELAGPDAGEGVRELSSQVSGAVRELLDAGEARAAELARAEEALVQERDRCTRLEAELAGGSLEASQSADRALREASERASQATKEASDLRMQLAERDAQLGVERSQAAACREKLEEASSENAALVKRSAELRAKLRQASSLLEALRRDVGENAEFASSLQLSANSLTAQLGSLRQEVSEGEAQLGEVWDTVGRIRGIVGPGDAAAAGSKPLELSSALQKGLRDLLSLLEVSAAETVAGTAAWCSLVAEGQERVRSLQLEVQNSTTSLVRLLSQQKENEDLARRALTQSRGLGERVSELSMVCTRLLQERQ